MKDRCDGKSNYKAGVGAHDWQPKYEEQKHMPHAVRDHPGQIPNADTKSSKKNLVSKDLQARQCNRLMKKYPRTTNEEGQPQTTLLSSKAPKRSSNLKAIMYDTNVTSLLTPRRTPIAKDSDEMHSHTTTCYGSLMENQHIVL